MSSQSYELGKGLSPFDKIDQFGIQSLTAAELIMTMLNKSEVVTDQLSVDLHDLFAKTTGQVPEVSDLLSIDGIDQENVIQIISAFEFSRRSFFPSKGYRLDKPALIYQMLKLYAYQSTETVVLLTLSSSQELIQCRAFQIDSSADVLVNTRQLSTHILNDSASGIIVAHVSSTGSLALDSMDRCYFLQLSDLVETLNVELLDYLIINRDGYYSFVENKMMSDMRV